MALITTSLLIGLFIVFQIYTSMATKKLETQVHKVIKQEKGFEIRHYPPVTMAMIFSTAKTYSELSSIGFTKLAGYVFGGNQFKKRIGMTSPVHMDIGDSVSRMSFVMPLSYTKDNLPQPDDSDVMIINNPEEYVAAIQFEGYASSDDIQKNMELLKACLKAQHLGYHGNFRYLGYNPPYQLVGRRNEIIVALDWDLR